MTEAMTKVPALLRDREPYRRPMVSRFEPSDERKVAVKTWDGADQLARSDVEGTGWPFMPFDPSQHTGYPTA